MYVEDMTFLENLSIVDCFYIQKRLFRKENSFEKKKKKKKKKIHSRKQRAQMGHRPNNIIYGEKGGFVVSRFFQSD